jgi:arylsulfatase A-like enzyme
VLIRPFVAVGVGLSLAVALALWGEQRSPRPNVVLITVDTLRSDRLGAYGEPSGTSPAVDRLVASGTAFRRLIVPRGQTWPTLASIQTSRYPVTHGVRRNGQTLPTSFLTLAEVLRDAGYEAAAFLANAGPAGWRGFDPLVDRRGDDGGVHADATAWMRHRAKQRFFLWIHYFGPHRPLDPALALVNRVDPGYEGPIDGSVGQMQEISAGRLPLGDADLRHLKAMYDAEIREVDRRILDLLRTIDDLGITDRTLVVLTADHGEELLDHNGYYGHSASIYDSVLRAPLVVRLPDAVPAGRWRSEIVEALDLAPTILEFAGVRVPAEFEGVSLAPGIRDARWVSGDRFAVSELEDRVVSLRTSRYRYVYNPSDFDFPLVDEGALVPIAARELYDHADDPAERRDVSADRADVCEELERSVRRWMETHEWDAASERHAAREIPAEMAEVLRSLGYGG